MAHASETLQQNAGCKQAREALDVAVDHAHQQLLELAAAARDLLEAFHERWALPSSCISFLKALSLTAQQPAAASAAAANGKPPKPVEAISSSSAAAAAAATSAQMQFAANANAPASRFQSSSRTASSGSLPISSSSRLRLLPEPHEKQPANAFNAAKHVCKSPRASALFALSVRVAALVDV